VVTSAKILCFLGFAYDRDNLSRLNLPTDLYSESGRLGIFGSAYGLSPGEQAWVSGGLGNQIQLGRTDQDCLDVPREFHIFRD
jgi:hypothetical protein